MRIQRRMIRAEALGESANVVARRPQGGDGEGMSIGDRGLPGTSRSVILLGSYLADRDRVYGRLAQRVEDRVAR